LAGRRHEPLSLALPALAKRPTPGAPPSLSRYAVELPYPSLPGARLVLQTNARVFEREVRLVEPAAARRLGGAGRAGRPGDREPEERTVASAPWRHADPDTPAPALPLEVPPTPATPLHLLIPEGDNAPLPCAPPPPP